MKFSKNYFLKIRSSNAAWRCSKTGKRKFSVLRLPISLGKTVSENDKFASLLDWVKDHFDSKDAKEKGEEATTLIIRLSDVFHRYNNLVSSAGVVVDEEDALKKTKKKVDKWLKDHLSVLNKVKKEIKLNLVIERWDDYTSIVKSKKMLSKISALINRGGDFSKSFYKDVIFFVHKKICHDPGMSPQLKKECSVDSIANVLSENKTYNVKDFIKEYKGEGKILEKPKTSKDLKEYIKVNLAISTAFLREELAYYAVGYEKNEAIDLYVGPEVGTLARIRNQEVLEPGIPKGLKKRIFMGANIHRYQK